MARLIKVTDAVAFGLHAVALLAKQPGAQTVKNLALALKVSQHHLAKVFQRLERAGLVASRRGPTGGFVLKLPAEKISVLDVYEAVEGEVDGHTCLLGRPRCDSACPLGALLRDQQEAMRAALAGLYLHTFARGLRLGAA
jgi:Rrf2 family protein